MGRATETNGCRFRLSPKGNRALRSQSHYFEEAPCVIVKHTWLFCSVVPQLSLSSAPRAELGQRNVSVCAEASNDAGLTALPSRAMMAGWRFAAYTTALSSWNEGVNLPCCGDS